jgi:hypothetical protein
MPSSVPMHSIFDVANIILESFLMFATSKNIVKINRKIRLKRHLVKL